MYIVVIGVALLIYLFFGYKLHQQFRNKLPPNKRPQSLCSNFVTKIDFISTFYNQTACLSVSIVSHITSSTISIIAIEFIGLIHKFSLVKAPISYHYLHLGMRAVLGTVTFELYNVNTRSLKTTTFIYTYI